MFQRYFVYKGKRYPSGTIIKMRFQHNACNASSEHMMAFSSVSGDNIYACLEIVLRKTHCFSEEQFFAAIIEITDQMHPAFVEDAKKRQMLIEKYRRKPTFAEQMNIPGLGLACIWYIIVMVVAIIFNDCIGIWIFASVIFFSYRKKKLREEGYKL